MDLSNKELTSLWTGQFSFEYFHQAIIATPPRQCVAAERAVAQNRVRYTYTVSVHNHLYTMHRFLGQYINICTL